MARTAGGLLGLGVLLLLLGTALVGCAPKPPCDGATEIDVETAQDQCAAATDQLEQARGERAALEAELTEVKAEMSKLEGEGTPSELASYLEELRKGSGR
jgi:hypothetical protein